MRKEVSIAIIIGVILGGIVLYGIKIASDTTNSLNSDPNIKPTSSISQPDPVQTTPTPPSTKSKLSITSHTNGQVISEKDITLQGKTIANSNLTIIWETDENILKSDELGNFEQKITLIPGENNIQIDVVEDNTTLISEQIKLYYTTKIIE